MADPLLSAALLRYLWGDEGLPWPGERPEALSVDQLNYLPQIRAIVETAFRGDPVYGTLAEMADRVEAIVRTEHPELSDEALQAVGTYYAFCFK